MRARLNLLASTDVDRHAIWEELVGRDIRAFLAEDWNRTVDDFHEDGFVGHSGPADPDQGEISYPALPSYREAWLVQARDFGNLHLKERDKVEFLFDATDLSRIEINQALAHKKFDGCSETIKTLAEQTHLTLRNCFSQLATGGATSVDVFRVTVYLKELDQWSAFNDVYRVCFAQSCNYALLATRSI